MQVLVGRVVVVFLFYSSRGRFGFTAVGALGAKVPEGKTRGGDGGKHDVFALTDLEPNCSWLVCDL